ncbi:acyltransferase family protein, partial [Brachybacterium sp. AOP42-B2-9]
MSPIRAAVPSTGAKTRFIPEIQGLRTLALFLVVIYHVWFHRVSGGVDVFLLVSAFLMTASVIAATRQGRGFNP